MLGFFVLSVQNVLVQKKVSPCSPPASTGPQEPRKTNRQFVMNAASEISQANAATAEETGSPPQMLHISIHLLNSLQVLIDRFVQLQYGFIHHQPKIILNFYFIILLITEV